VKQSFTSTSTRQWPKMLHWPSWLSYVAGPSQVGPYPAGLTEADLGSLSDYLETL
jgi:hypothetical protein